MIHFQAWLAVRNLIKVAGHVSTPPSRVALVRGELRFPVRERVAESATDDALADLAGADLLTQAPEVASWICAQAPAETLCIGNYTYLDGAKFVRLAVAADVVIVLGSEEFVQWVGG